MAFLNQTALEVGQVLLSAPFEEAGWGAGLRQVAHFTRSSHGELIGISSAREVSFNWTTETTPEFFTEFIELGGGNPSVNWRVACTGAPFEVRSEADYARVRSERPGQYAAYDEFAHRYDMADGCQTVLLREKGMFIGLAALRTRSDGQSTPDDRDAFAAVAPYVLSAVRMQHSLENQGSLLLAGALEQMKAAAVLCDGNGLVCGLTAAADEWLASSCRLTVRNRRLLAANPDENRRLGHAIRNALSAGVERGAVDRFWLRGEAGYLDSQICEVFPLPRKPWSFGFEPRVIIIIRWPTGLASEGRQLLQEMWSLSPAECAIAMLLAQGRSREQIAAERGTSAMTVQTQIKSLFRKCGVNREAELLALLRDILR